MSSESPNPDPRVLRAGGTPAVPSDGLTLDSGLGLSADAGFGVNLRQLLDPPQSPDELGWLAHYRVIKLLGRGGMGAVFQAEDTHLRRVVALKVILPALATHPTARERFLREARAGAALKSDHVVTIYQVGQDRDIPFLAMEFLEGETLEARLARGGLLPIPEVLRIGREAALGLAAAHAQGLIHRDVKPANVWLEAPAGRVKLLDFGLVKAAGSRPDLTHPGQVAGTPEFMSPEQGQDEELDARSDLFCLGAVLYVMCTGQKPFQGSTPLNVLMALATKRPRPVRELNPAVPPTLGGLVERLLEKDRAKRPASAVEVGNALAAIEGGVVPAARLRRRWLVPAGILAAIVLLGVVAVLSGWFGPRRETAGPPSGPTEVPPAAPSGPPIRIGVLHSRSGTMAISERPVIDAVLLAVEEINTTGGLLGRPVEAVVADGQSDEQAFARQVEKLIREDKVCVVFGCWTSASRKAVVPVVERHDHLLVYPVQYEGVEQSPNIVYLGPVPNQQILPALRWLVGFENRRRWFLVGSDYVFPVTANAVVKDEAKARGCEVVGEEYLLLGSTDVDRVIRAIVEARPDLIVNTINGDTNVAFFRGLRRAKVTTKAAPALSFSISEEELGQVGPGEATGDFVAGNYFQSTDTPQNREFLARFGRRYGAERVVSAPMQSAYAGVHLWAAAVRAAGHEDPRAVREAVKGRQYDAPQGPIRIDLSTLHTVQTVRVGRVDRDGRVVEEYQSPQPVVPEPFPASRDRKEWTEFVEGLHKRWGGRWSNPGS